MKVLVTGGAGFVGSHIVDECVRLGYEVVIADDLSSGARNNLHPEVKFYQISINDPQIHEIIEREQIEAIIHQAAQVGVPASIEDPHHDATINILGTVNLLEAAKKYKLKKFVYASSAAIYGTPDVVPIDEQHPLRPMSPYGISKKVGEEYVKLYGELFDIDYVTYRYANIYGPRQGSGEGSVVPVFLSRMIEGETVNIHGDGNQTRDLIYVRDVARANVMALTSGAKGSFNLGTNTALTINELFGRLKELTGYSKDAVYGPARAGDIYHSRLDNTALLGAMEWQPETTLIDGLKETISWWNRKLEQTHE